MEKPCESKGNDGFTIKVDIDSKDVEKLAARRGEKKKGS